MPLFRLLLVVLLLAIGGVLLVTGDSGVSARDISPDHDVVLFSAEWCGYCDQARSWLEHNRVDFLEINVESSTEARRAWRDAGGRGVPLTFIGEERINGFSPSNFGGALERL